MPSALQHPDVVEEYVSKECAERRVIGPLPLGLVPRLQVSSFGVIPKKNQPNKWRLILDLSHPAEVSVNDGISESLSTLSYITNDTVTDKICQLGQGSLLAKMDVQHAFRLVPVHPDDRWLLGMKWKEQYYIDTVLPFGLRSAPKIFTALANALQWIICRQVATWVANYLDDFVTLGKLGTSDCAHNQTIISDVCASLGVPLAPEKVEGPTTCLTFLGIEIDTVTMELWLPKKKISQLTTGHYGMVLKKSLHQT